MTEPTFVLTAKSKRQFEQLIRDVINSTNKGKRTSTRTPAGTSEQVFVECLELWPFEEWPTYKAKVVLFHANSLTWEQFPGEVYLCEANERHLIVGRKYLAQRSGIRRERVFYVTATDDEIITGKLDGALGWSIDNSITVATLSLYNGLTDTGEDVQVHGTFLPSGSYLVAGAEIGVEFWGGRFHATIWKDADLVGPGGTTTTSTTTTTSAPTTTTTTTTTSTTTSTTTTTTEPPLDDEDVFGDNSDYNSSGGGTVAGTNLGNPATPIPNAELMGNGNPFLAPGGLVECPYWPLEPRIVIVNSNVPGAIGRVAEFEGNGGQQYVVNWFWENNSIPYHIYLAIQIEPQTVTGWIRFSAFWMLEEWASQHTIAQSPETWQVWDKMCRNPQDFTFRMSNINQWQTPNFGASPAWISLRFTNRTAE